MRAKIGEVEAVRWGMESGLLAINVVGVLQWAFVSSLAPETTLPIRTGHFHSLSRLTKLNLAGWLRIS